MWPRGTLRGSRTQAVVLVASWFRRHDWMGNAPSPGSGTAPVDVALVDVRWAEVASIVDAGVAGSSVVVLVFSVKVKAIDNAAGRVWEAGDPDTYKV